MDRGEKEREEHHEQEEFGGGGGGGGVGGGGSPPIGGERQYSKLEEALKVESLRRFICAYVNYPDAAVEDVRRYERSFEKLPPSHKALLSHLPLKYQRLRRCISANQYFIMSMLEAFEPPIDMSQDIDVDECKCEEGDPHSHGSNVVQSSSGSGICPKPPLPSTQNSSSCPDSSSPHQGDNVTGMLSVISDKEEMHNEYPDAAITDRSTGCECRKGSCEGGLDDLKVDVDSASCQNTNGSVNLPMSGLVDASFQLNVPLVDVDKVRWVIRNIVRDWAHEGQKERDQCYKPILEELKRLFPNRSKERPPFCLVPGAGLGRLALEISSLGFVSQGNEFSYFSMICSSFILNHTQAAGEWTIYPWLHSNCNSISDADQLRPVSIPDIHPSSAGITEGFSMSGGDFVKVYNDESQEASWDAVVTSFFVDTAHNIVEYIEIIAKILKSGGVWINFGPLLYHIADSYGEEEMSIELCLEDVKKVAFHYGFEMEMERMIETTYSANPRSMMQNHYFAAFWTMKKK